MKLYTSLQRGCGDHCYFVITCVLAINLSALYAVLGQLLFKSNSLHITHNINNITQWITNEISNFVTCSNNIRLVTVTILLR